MTDDTIVQTCRSCSRCGEEKLLAEFVGKKKGATDCRQCNSCRAYGNELRKRNPDKTKAARARAFVAWRVKHPKVYSEPLISSEGRLCRTCGQRKDSASFTRDDRSVDGLSWRCRDCYHAAHADWRRANIDHVRDTARGARRRRSNPELDRKTLRANRLKKFGLTYDDFRRMLIAQHFKCAICYSEIKIEGSYSDAACVDHNHTTGAIRELLCHRCNSGMGLFKDSPKLIHAVLEYLRKHSS